MTDIAQMDNFIASLGVEAYRVGGSVRDELIGRDAKDADYMVRGKTLVELGYTLVSAARPLGGKVTRLQLRDGRQAGFRVRLKFGDAEIVLPRKEVSTGPGHRDFEITVDKDVTLEEDAQRRDFTFNALYKPVGDGNGNLVGDETDTRYAVDPTKRGLYDLERRLINVTHDDSFRDDPLRILRALRFVAREYDLGAHTQQLMTEHADAITGLTSSGNTSGTVFEEMEKILSGTNAVGALRLARDTGVLVQLFPELKDMIGFDQKSKWHDFTVDEHTFKALETAVKGDAPMRIRWSLLFHDSGKPESAWIGEDGRQHFCANQIKFSQYVVPPGFAAAPVDPEAFGFQTEDHAVIGERRWREAAARINVPKKLREEVATLIREHMLGLEGKFRATKVRLERVRLGDQVYGDVLLHRICDCSGKQKMDAKSVERLQQIGNALSEARMDNVPASIKDLEINGNDLIVIGIRGEDIGRVLKGVLHEVASDPSDQKLARGWQLARAANIA